MGLLITSKLLDMLKLMAQMEIKSKRLMSLLKKRGYIQPAFELYGGVGGLYDYGPLGGRLRRNVNKIWLNHWIALGNIVEIDSPTVTPEEVLKASGHIGAFNDFASECKSCNSIFRSDHLLEGLHPNPDSLNEKELEIEFKNNNIPCPSCKKNNWDLPKPLNLMFSTTIGASKNGRRAYMRPETAQGMFLQFPSIHRHFRGKLPFGAIQIGKGYRNEISPRQGIIRLREFNMAELEYFIDPEEDVIHDFNKWKDIELRLIPENIQGSPVEIKSNIGDAVKNGMIRHQTVGWFMIKTFDLMMDLGLNPDLVRFRQHEKNEMAHYATDCWDLEIFGSYGWTECVGIAHRGCYDLQAHDQAASSNELKAWREFEKEKIIEKTICSPIQSIIGPTFKEHSKQISNELLNLEKMPESFPFEIKCGESIFLIEEKMIEIKNIKSIERGEWYTPHVIEPAFGIDRIIWHILEHSYNEIDKKDDENYALLSLNESIAPINFAIYPLFEKEGLKEKAEEILNSLREIKGINVYYDGSKSIGRRYARGDEVGVPFAITVDPQTISDGTITLRYRDSQKQERISILKLLEFASKFI